MARFQLYIPRSLSCRSNVATRFFLSLCVNANAFMTGVLWLLALWSTMMPTSLAKAHWTRNIYYNMTFKQLSRWFWPKYKSQSPLPGHWKQISTCFNRHDKCFDLKYIFTSKQISLVSFFRLLRSKEPAGSDLFVVAVTWI